MTQVDGAATDDLHGWRERALTPTLISVALVVAMMSSLGAPLIPSIARADHITISTGQWLLTSTLLAGAVASPIMGQLSDGRHRRLVIIWALVIVLIGSITAAVLDGFTALVIGRSLQGMGLGLVPVAMVIARRHLPRHKSANVIGILSISAAMGLGLGYPITGLIAEKYDYHVAFWFGAAVVALALVLAIIVLPHDRTAATSRLDVTGAVLFTILLLSLLIAVSEGVDWGWASGRVLGLLLIALVTGVVWVRYELHASAPLVVLRHLKIRAVLAANLCGSIIGVAMYLFVPVIVEFVQIPHSEGYGFGASVAVSGLCLVPLSVGTAVASTVLPRIRERFGARSTVLFGQLVFATGMLFFAYDHDALWQAFVTMGLGGLGVGLSFGAMPGFIVAAVPTDETGTAMGLYQVIRSTGLAIGSALSASILAGYTRPHHSLPVVDGYRTTLIVAAILCLSVGVVSRWLPARNAPPQPVNVVEVADAAALS